MDLTPVTSTNVRAVGYDAVNRTLRVQFKGGRVYDYFDVDSALFHEMLEPYPWHRVGKIVMAHRYNPVR